jgi:hypothetical protein
MLIQTILPMACFVPLSFVGFFLIILYNLFPQHNHDCGFHMLKHAEHWDDCAIYDFTEEDIPKPNIGN